MAENIRLEVVTPEKVVVDENAQIVVAPGVWVSLAYSLATHLF